MVDPIGEYAVLLEVFDGKELKGINQEGLDIDYEDDLNKIEEFKAEFKPRCKLFAPPFPYDSEDLPLNISRETLQQNKILPAVKKNLVKKCLEILEGQNDIYFIAGESIAAVEVDGKKLKGATKEGLDLAKAAELIRYHLSTPGDEQICMREYANRTKEGQNGIYHINGASIAAVSSLLFLVALRMKGLELLHIADPVAEYAVQQLKEFGGMELKSTTKKGLDIEDEGDKKKIE
eukprot:10480910-Karenia_brevis.AAC.1